LSRDRGRYDPIDGAVLEVRKPVDRVDHRVDTLNDVLDSVQIKSEATDVFHPIAPGC
jgi:hypothetical protein